MKDDHAGEFKILRAVAIFIIPIILLYGAYITLNGHLSAGGGFSGGTIIGVAVILFNIAFGSEVTDRLITFRGCVRTISLSLLTYLILIGITFFMGANGRRAFIPLGTPGNILSGGLILPLNICVALVVASMMYMLYSLFSHWGGRLD
jgi:multicomponent Na+:H+ antiporter subunit B